jgi:hypothetical protein
MDLNRMKLVRVGRVAICVACPRYAVFTDHRSSVGHRSPAGRGPTGKTQNITQLAVLHVLQLAALRQVLPPRIHTDYFISYYLVGMSFIWKQD